jgi:hypothetical protein
LVFMNTGDLMDAVRPFLRAEATGDKIMTGPGGSLPDPSGGGPVFPLLAESQRDEETGSPVWGDLSPLEELSPLEGGEDRDLEAGPSNSQAPKRRRFLDDRLTSWKTRDQVARDLADKKSDRTLISIWEREMVELLVKMKGKPFSVSRDKWRKAAETLLRGKPLLYFDKVKELFEQREESPFYRSLLELVVKWEEEKRTRQHQERKKKKRGL